MPTHYRPDSIGFAIEAVLNQTEQRFEVLVVGDGAAPETAAVVQRYDDPRVRWFDLPKAPGYGYANRNIAMAESCGELVAFASDDDLMLPDHLERLGALFDDPQVQWAYSQALWVSTDGIAGPDLTNLSFDDERQVFEQHNTISGGALVFRASAFPSRRCWPEETPVSGDWQQMRWLLRQYGLAGMRRLAEPTFLHFVAGQKGTRHSNFPLLAAWLSIADSAAWWPKELKPNLSGELPQAHYSRLLGSDPALVRKLRSAAADLANRVALEAIAPRTVVNPAIRAGAGLEAELDAARRERDAMQQQRDGARQAVDAMHSSTIWRAAAPLRAVMHKLRGQRVP
jgi:glycosyltransferase involved in cell wall biosynthesis